MREENIECVCMCVCLCVLSTNFGRGAVGVWIPTVAILKKHHKALRFFGFLAPYACNNENFPINTTLSALLLFFW